MIEEEEEKAEFKTNIISHLSWPHLLVVDYIYKHGR